MKKLLFLSLLFSQIALAQNNSLALPLPQYQQSMPKLGDATFDISKLPMDGNHVYQKDTFEITLPNNFLENKTMLADAKFSHSTSRGLIYILSPDNMPCLVPDLRMVEQMPNKKINKAQQRDFYGMPNPIAPKKLPSQK